MRMETKRLVVRDYEPEDIDDYYRLKSDVKTMYYLHDLQLFSKEDAISDLNHVLLDKEDKERLLYFFHIERKDTHEQVGSVGYTVIDTTPVGKLVHAGYFTYPQFWNQGYVTEALRKVLEFAFLHNNVYRVTTGCLQENKGSERVMQKCGFIKEAEHKDWEWHDGRMKTRVEYRLLREEWERYEHYYSI